MNDLHLLSESPQDLQEQLTAIAPKESLKGRKIYLALIDSEILFRPFQFDNAVNLEHQLSMEAVKLLSLPVGDIILDYQMTSQANEQIMGIYICGSRRRLKEYNDIFLRFKVYPVQLIPYALVIANYFFSDKNLENKQHVLIDCFKPSQAVLGVFARSQCVLMRLIQYESLENLKIEINSSILSACAASRVKQCDGFYFYGNYDQKEEVLNFCRTNYGEQVLEGGQVDLSQMFSIKNKIFYVHFLRNELLGIYGHRKVFYGLSVVFIILLLGVVGLWMCLVQQQVQIHQLQIILQGLK